MYSLIIIVILWGTMSNVDFVTVFLDVRIYSSSLSFHISIQNRVKTDILGSVFLFCFVILLSCIVKQTSAPKYFQGKIHFWFLIKTFDIDMDKFRQQWHLAKTFAETRVKPSQERCQFKEHIHVFVFQLFLPSICESWL